jgi:hypothetical protein
MPRVHEQWAAPLPLTTNQQVSQLTPLNWKKAREKSLQPAA